MYAYVCVLYVRPYTYLSSLHSCTYTHTHTQHSNARTQTHTHTHTLSLPLFATLSLFQIHTLTYTQSQKPVRMCACVCLAGTFSILLNVYTHAAKRTHTSLYTCTHIQVGYIMVLLHICRYIYIYSYI